MNSYKFKKNQAEQPQPTEHNPRCPKCVEIKTERNKEDYYIEVIISFDLFTNLISVRLSIISEADPPSQQKNVLWFWFRPDSSKQFQRLARWHSPD